MKNMFLENKMAGMEVKMLVSTIAIGLGFVILLIIYSQFFFTQEIDKQVCHESIVARNTFNMGVIEAGKVSIPLKCQTEKICLFRDKKDCSYAFGDKSDENIITPVELNKDNNKAKIDAMDTIANAMYDCHSMLGEGKMNFMPHDWGKDTYCLICSRIALDNVSKDVVSNITFVEFYNYLGLKKNLDGISYLKYLYGADKASDMNAGLESSRIFVNEELGKNIGSINDFKIILSQENAILVKMVTKGTWSSWIGSSEVVAVSGVLIGAALSATGIGAFVGVPMMAIAVGGGAATAGVITFAKTYPSDKYTYVGPIIIPYTKEELSAGVCTSFETAP